MGNSINVSATGVLVTVRDPVKAGTRVKVLFVQPSAYNIFEGRGEVVRCEDHGNGSFTIAVTFIGLTPADREKLDQYITSGEPDRP